MNKLNFVKLVLNVFSISVPFIAITTPSAKSLLWSISLFAVFLLMIIRPLGDIFPSLKLYRILPLRKNLGIFSATIVVTYGLIHYYNLGFVDFIKTYFSLNYWSFENSKFWAHLGELTGFILLITSNKFSVRILKRNWKRIQRLSYVYFFSGSWYVFSAFFKTYALIYILIVFNLTFFAFVKKRINKKYPIN